MKRTLLLAISLTVIVVFSVSAAPARDLRISDEEMDLVIQVQLLADAVAAVAWNQQITLYRNGTAPEQYLIESLLLEALQSQLLFFETEDQTARLKDEQVKTALDHLFYYEQLPSIQIPLNQAISRTSDGLRFDLSGQKDYIGAYIYHVGISEDEILVAADVYHLSGIRSSALEAPEESLTWLGHLGIRFKAEPSSPLGFTLASFSMPEIYQAKNFLLFEEKEVFELQYPDLFSVVKSQPNAYLSLESQDGLSRLSVVRTQETLEDLKEEWEKETDYTTVFFREDGRLFFVKDGEYRIAVADNDEDAAGSSLVMTLVFPILKPNEYELYWQFLDNSFVIYSEAFG